MIIGWQLLLIQAGDSCSVQAFLSPVGTSTWYSTAAPGSRNVFFTCSLCAHILLYYTVVFFAFAGLAASVWSKQHAIKSRECLGHVKI